MYAKGLGVAQNFTEAQKWLRKAMEQNNAASKKALQSLTSFLNVNAQEKTQDEKLLEQLELIF
jgi:TPR repeat protein